MEQGELTDKTVSMTGAAVNTAVAMERTDEEIQKIVLLIIPLCFVILVLTTTSWLEPVLFMVTIGVAILLNQGTNLIFGEISFVTNAAGKYSPISCLDGLLYFSYYIDLPIIGKWVGMFRMQ